MHIGISPHPDRYRGTVNVPAVIGTGPGSHGFRKWVAGPHLLVAVCCILFVGNGTLRAQDPQFSQFYAAPLYLNPALAGSTNQARAGINYRNQWPAIDANFTTMSFFADYFIEDKNSGVGFLLTRDREGLAGLRSMSLALQYSYELQLTDFLGFRPGVQLGLYNRDVNFDRLTFGDQFDPSTGEFIDQPSAERWLAPATVVHGTNFDVGDPGPRQRRRPGAVGRRRRARPRQGRRPRPPRRPVLRPPRLPPRGPPGP